MDWTLIAQIVAKEGLPLAEALFTKWKSGNAPTLQDFADLRALGAQTAKTQLMDAAKRAGLAVDDPKVVALLALLP